ncbi:MAG: V-type ATP synthase subunit D [Oscillospiraceae bacterium]
MIENIFPTKGNLLAVKKSLFLAKTGFELLDKKRNILIREMMTLIDLANAIRNDIDSTYKKAYLSLQRANITLGVCENMACAIPIENSIDIKFRSVMGVEIPTVTYEKKSLKINYGISMSNSQLDYAYKCFDKVKELTITLAQLENSVYKLAIAIKKTQKRANALKNIIIPDYTHAVKFITSALEEKEREEFSRLKVIKQTKNK